MMMMMDRTLRLVGRVDGDEVHNHSGREEDGLRCTQIDWSHRRRDDDHEWGKRLRRRRRARGVSAAWHGGRYCFRVRIYRSKRRCRDLARVRG